MHQVASHVVPGKGIEWLARLGYVAKGVVYIGVGVLSALAALNAGGRTTNTKGAINTIGQQPYGQALLIALAVGLIGYVFWRFVQAFKDPDNRGHGFGGLFKRTGLFFSGVIYGLLALYTIRLLVGGHSAGGHSKDSMTAKVMSHQGGIWAIAAIGGLIIIVAIIQFVRAYRRKFEKQWDLTSMGRIQRRWARRITRWGLSARGVVFLIIGGFLVLAAWHTNPQKATGLDGALNTLAEQSYGVVLLMLVALGLVCYGLYCWFNAVYRQINA